MPDHKTQRFLRNIGKTIPPELLRGAMVTKDPFSDQREKAVKAMHDPRTKPAEREFYRRQLQNNSYQTHQVVDKKKEEEIDRFITTKVHGAIRRGEIQDPKTDKDTKQFIQRMRKQCPKEYKDPQE